MKNHGNKPLAKEKVELKKVKTRHQRVNLSEGEIKLLKKIERLNRDRNLLTNDEITVINILEKQKLFLRRILLMFNQARATLGMDLLKKSDMLGLLENLISKGLVGTKESPSGERVYFLTDAGLDFLGIL
ncbi:MAG: hypothetical protein ACTSRA_15175 [Promethearchaeota archaeon]